MIPVTKPFLPPREKYDAIIDGIWQRNWLTNNGPLVNELELRLKEYLGMKHLLYVSNGTIALQLAIKALDLKGKIITTPFSYVATTSSIVWENCQPVFVDIDPDTLNIDPKRIEAAIDDETSGIVATHCFGNACDIDAIEAIAKKRNLKIIFDAAHGFGTKYRGRSIFDYGDISTASFHATKLFHTIEGGAVLTRDPALLRRLALMRNFGHKSVDEFEGVGINAKNSEFHAAMGLCNLSFVDKILRKRRQQSLYYDKLLNKLAVTRPKIQNECEYNYAYYPVIFKSEEAMLEAKKALDLKEIFPRRYFHPCLSTLEYVKKYEIPTSLNISKRILCLPLYHDLSLEEQTMIGRILLRVQKYG